MPILIHMTAAYSNAVLVALLPHFSDFAHKLDLPVPQPITVNQVRRFKPCPFQGYIGGGISLTNHYGFSFNDGFVDHFNCPDDWFESAQDNWDHLERYVGKDNMTTNEAIQLARDSFRKLGYKPEDFGVDGQPTKTIGPDDLKGLGHIPYFEVNWESPEPKSQEEFERSYHIRFDISLQQKRVVGMLLISRRFWKPNPKVDVVPELESDYRKRNQAHLFIRTNAPPHWPSNQATDSKPAIPPTGGQEIKQE